MPLSHSSQYADLTEEQYACIGRIMVESSNLEHLVERLLVRLAGSPDFLGLSLTNPLSATRRLEALKTLVDVHRRRYNCHLVDSAVLDEIDQAQQGIDSLRIDRNRFAHYCWCRQDNERIFGIKFTGKQPDVRKPGRDCVVFTLTELDDMIADMKILVEHLEALLEQLPEEPEMPR